MTGKTLSDPEVRAELFRGAADTLPLILAAIPFGLLYGALCQAFGFSLFLCLSMSALVFAGSAQFVAVNLLAAGTPWLVVVAATFIVNLRHLMYSANLMKNVRPYSQRRRAVMAFGLTDETFATVLNRLQRQPHRPFSSAYLLGSAAFMYANWFACSALGYLASGQFEDPLSWGLEVAMVVAFIGIVAPLLVDHLKWLCALLAGSIALLTHSWPYQSGILLAATVAILIPTWLGLRKKGDLSKGTSEA